MASISGDFSTNLLTHWKLDEASGTRIDSNGLYDLIDVNTVGQGTGKQGNCADFEAGNGERLESSDSVTTTFKGLGDFTFNIWLQQESDNPSTGNTGRRVLFWRNDTVQIATSKEATNSYSSWVYIRDAVGFEDCSENIGDIDVSSWYMLTVVRDQSAGTVAHYVNGSLVATTTGLRTNVLRSDSTKIGIGGIPGSSSYVFDGLLDEASFWNRTLDSNEVSTLYNSGAGIPYDAGGGGGTNLQLNIADSWKTVDAAKINVGDAWKDVTSMSINVGDSWKTIF